MKSTRINRLEEYKAGGKQYPLIYFGLFAIFFAIRVFMSSSFKEGTKEKKGLLLLSVDVLLFILWVLVCLFINAHYNQYVSDEMMKIESEKKEDEIKEQEILREYQVQDIFSV